MLRSEKFELAEQLKETQALLRVQSEGWKKEKNKTLNLMFSESPGSHSHLVLGVQEGGEEAYVYWTPPPLLPILVPIIKVGVATSVLN